MKEKEKEKEENPMLQEMTCINCNGSLLGVVGLFSDCSGILLKCQTCGKLSSINFNATTEVPPKITKSIPNYV